MSSRTPGAYKPAALRRMSLHRSDRRGSVPSQAGGPAWAPNPITASAHKLEPDPLLDAEVQSVRRGAYYDQSQSSLSKTEG